MRGNENSAKHTYTERFLTIYLASWRKYPIKRRCYNKTDTWCVCAAFRMLEVCEMRDINVSMPGGGKERRGEERRGEEHRGYSVAAAGWKLSP